MSISLYDASVGSYLRGLSAAEHFLAKARTHFEAEGVDPDSLLSVSLHPEMWPFRQQVVSLAHHSAGAAKALQEGLFTPPTDKRDHDYAGLQQVVAEALAYVKSLTPEAIEARSGEKVIFRLGEHEMPFTTESFVMGFSLPNFMFHSTTAYDLLRQAGAPLGKRDFMSAPRKG